MDTGIIGIIGAGRVGVSLGKYWSENGLRLGGFYSRRPEAAKEAAAYCKTKGYVSLAELMQECDTIVLTVPDGSIAVVCEQLLQYPLAGKELMHCSGAKSSEVFDAAREKGAKGISLHPMAPVADRFGGAKRLAEACFTAEGDEESVTRWMAVMKKLGNRIERIDAPNKVRYHAAAVFSSNLVIGLYAMACDLLVACGLSTEFAEEALAGLLVANTGNLAEKGPKEALTGPVERNDWKTVQAHQTALHEDGRVVYDLLSKRLLAIAQEKYPERDYTALLTCLQQTTDKPQ